MFFQEMKLVKSSSSKMSINVSSSLHYEYKSYINDSLLM